MVLSIGETCYNLHASVANRQERQTHGKSLIGSGYIGSAHEEYCYGLWLLGYVLCDELIRITNLATGHHWFLPTSIMAHNRGHVTCCHNYEPHQNEPKDSDWEPRVVSMNHYNGDVGHRTGPNGRVVERKGLVSQNF